MKQHAVCLCEQDLNAPSVAKTLRAEGISVSHVGVHKLLEKYRETGTVARREVFGRPSKVTERVRELIEAQMCKDNETIAKELQKLLADSGFQLSVQTMLSCRSLLGWTRRGSSYCQLIGG